MSRTRRTFTEEFKQQIFQLYNNWKIPSRTGKRIRFNSIRIRSMDSAYQRNRFYQRK